MSGCPHVVWALRQRGLNASERLVLIYLADKANGSMVCWPALPTIADALELSPRTVHTAVHRLEALKLIRIEAKSRQSHHYHILRPKDANPASHVANFASEPAASNLANGDIQPCKTQQIDLATVARNPPKEESPKESPKSARARAREARDAEGWTEFLNDWPDSPHKNDPGRTYREFVRAVKAIGGDYQDLLDALCEAKMDDHRFKGDPQYTPHPGKWLKDGPWHLPKPKTAPKPAPLPLMEAGHAD